MNDKDWERTLALGIQVEEELLAALRYSYPEARRVSNLPTHDLEVNGKWIEVKDDIAGDSTGNFAYEVFGMGGKKSGLSVCEADYFVSVTKTRFIFQDTEKLKQYLKANWENFRSVNGGYMNYSRMKLVPQSLIMNQSFTTSILRKVPDQVILRFLIDG